MKASASKQGLRLKSEGSRSINARSDTSFIRRSSTKEVPTSAEMLSSLPTSELLTRRSTAANNDNHDDNSHLVQEVANLKLRLSTTLAHIDDEKHSRRLQTAKISSLCNENANLKSDLERACRHIVDLQNNAIPTEPNPDIHTSSCASTEQAEGRKEQNVHALFHRFIISKVSSMSSTTYANADTPSLASSSTFRRRSSLMESLADEELPARRSSSICSSLDFSNIRGQRRASNTSLYSEKMEDDEWLDERCILGDGVVQNTYAAQRA